MKSLMVSVIVLTIVSLSLAVAAPPAASTDPVTVAPNNYKLVFENERVRVLDVTLKPGETIPMHVHPDHLGYAFTPAKLKLSHPDGTSQVAELQPGQVAWIKAESHSTQNLGTVEFHALVVELK